MFAVLLCSWVDAGKFLTGFSAVGSIAIPAILAHAQVRPASFLSCHQAMCCTSYHPLKTHLFLAGRLVCRSLLRRSPHSCHVIHTLCELGKACAFGGEVGAQSLCMISASSLSCLTYAA
eukprot:GHUV01023112.1.p3 GENE.GHUV01023112.1~~GHUV01023112.1.p3  ORF type:complete len:119 (+),score=9.09 GHUV01023112.1:98-454(+)